MEEKREEKREYKRARNKERMKEKNEIIKREKRKEVCLWKEEGRNHGTKKGTEAEDKETETGIRKKRKK